MMSDQSEKSSGGFHFGSVGGAVNLNAGGDIVGGDKTTSTTTQNGFAAKEHEQQSQMEIDHGPMILSARHLFGLP